MITKDSFRQEKYSVEDLRDIVRILREPGGCPWDAEQSHKSIRRDLLEEAYEVADAIVALHKLYIGRRLCIDHADGVAGHEVVSVVEVAVICRCVCYGDGTSYSQSITIADDIVGVGGSGYIEIVPCYINFGVGLEYLRIKFDFVSIIYRIAVYLAYVFCTLGTLYQRLCIVPKLPEAGAYAYDNYHHCQNCRDCSQMIFQHK